jgi:hypothetical protein
MWKCSKRGLPWRLGGAEGARVMIDHFAEFGLRRGPWLDGGELKALFHGMAAGAHPDRSTGSEGAFTALNQAYRVLRDPAQRLRHWLELEDCSRGGEMQSVSESLSAVFMEVSSLGREQSVFLRKSGSAVGALGKALLAGERENLRKHWREMDGRLQELFEDAEEELRGVGAQWERREFLGEGGWEGVVAAVTSLQQRFALLGKWRHQVAESLLALEI